MEQKSIIHLILTVTPAVLIIFILFQIIFSEYGIFEAKSVEIQYTHTLNDIDVVQDSNQELRLRIERLKNTHKASHLAGERLLIGTSTSTLYRFQDSK